MNAPAPSGVSPERFRELLGRFATGVTVVTTVDWAGQACGMTASAVAAVSLSPPILLVCVNRAAKFHEALLAAQPFAVSVLAEHQADVSQHFARDHPDPFAAVAHHRDDAGPPVIDDAAAHIVCAPWGTHEAGDHIVFFGVVTGGQAFPRAPLLHVRGHYARLAPDDAGE